MRLVVAKRIVLALGAVATAAILLDAGDGDFNLFVLGFLAWCLLPLAILGIAGRASDALSVRVLLLAAAVVVAGGGVYLYVEAMILYLDPQSALVFVIAPALQLIATAAAMAVVGLLRWRSRVSAPGA